MYPSPGMVSHIAPSPFVHMPQLSPLPPKLQLGLLLCPKWFFCIFGFCKQLRLLLTWSHRLYLLSADCVGAEVDCSGFITFFKRWPVNLRRENFTATSQIILEFRLSIAAASAVCRS